MIKLHEHTLTIPCHVVTNAPSFAAALPSPIIVEKRKKENRCSS